MSAALYDSIRRIARHEANGRATSGIGRVVSAFDAGAGSVPPDHAVTVEMRDSGLVLPRVPVAVGVMGFSAIPAVGDLVLVVFNDGDFNAPIVAGRLYHPDIDPPEHTTDELVLSLPPSQAKGDLHLVVNGQTPSIALEMPDDVKVDIQAGDVSVTVGAIKLTLTGSGGGQAKVEAGGSTITLKQDGNIEVQSAADLSFKANGNIAIEGNQVEVKGLAKVAVSGAQVSIG